MIFGVCLAQVWCKKHWNVLQLAYKLFDANKLLAILRILCCTMDGKQLDKIFTFHGSWIFELHHHMHIECLLSVKWTSFSHVAIKFYTVSIAFAIKFIQPKSFVRDHWFTDCGSQWIADVCLLGRLNRQNYLLVWITSISRRLQRNGVQ